MNPQTGQRSAKTTTRRKHRKIPLATDREFIAWDCEGYSPGGREFLPQQMCLFGNSTLNYISGEELPTLDILAFIIAEGKRHPLAMHVAFAFKYDVNMIVRDIPKFLLYELFKSEPIFWNDYRLHYIPSKWFEVTNMVGLRTTVRIQDVFSFFACSFVKALRSWKVGTDAEIEFIEDGKRQRSIFRMDMLDTTILPYWKLEIVLLRQLCERLRDILWSGGFQVDRWYGPGAVASYVYQHKGMKACLDREQPDEIIEAAQYAYAGGRFELLRAGLFEGDIYTADINSAYPYAMSLMPNLATGYWHFTTDTNEIMEAARGYLGLLRTGNPPVGPRMAMVDITYEFSPRTKAEDSKHGWPFPGVHRSKLGQIYYPKRNSTWVHLPEFALFAHLQDSEPYAFQQFEIHGAWIFHDDGNFPFSWVSELYAQRAIWKAEGNPAQLAAKLAINSLYGKLAQRVGSKDKNGNVRIPKWHQLEYAGHITSHCRAQVWLAGGYVQEGVFAFETDGVFSTNPFPGLHTGEGDGLGQWKVEHYTGVLYLQSGVYWLKGEDGEWKPPKARGVPTAQLDVGRALESLALGIPLTIESHVFNGFNTATRQRNKGWRSWGTNIKEFAFGGSGKRTHVPPLCGLCPNDPPGPVEDAFGNLYIGGDMHVDSYTPGLHNLTARHPSRDDMRSHKHKLPWRGGTYDGMSRMMAEADAEIEVGDDY